MEDNEKYEIIALFGESGAGKDTIQKWIVNNFPEVNGIVSCTTRPMRENEKEGIDYFFLNPTDFAEKVLNGDMIEATSFRDWFYGTPIEALKKDKINVGVFNIQGIDCLLQDSRLIVKPIHIFATDKERLIRSLNREEKPDCEEICRRFLADKKDFSEVDFWHAFYYNKEGKPIDKQYWEKHIGTLDKGIQE